MLEKKSIFILFSNSKTYREYKYYFPWKLFESNFNFILAKSNKRAVVESPEIIFSLNSFVHKLCVFIHYCQLWQRRGTNIMFDFQMKMYFGKIHKTPSIFWGLDKRFSYFEKLLIRLFSQFQLLSIIKSLCNYLFKLESKKNKIDLSQIHCFLLPYTGGINPEWDYLVWLGNSNNIPTIAVQENWDNLSSKMFLFHHPSHFLTWGGQSSLHLRKFQRFNGQVVEFGSFRIEPFYSIPKAFANNALSMNFTKAEPLNKILVVGSGNANNDLVFLEEFTKFRSINPFSPASKLKISYRPHPFVGISRQMEFIERIKEINNLEILSSELFHEQRIQQINESICVISFYSTVSLEALILNKYCIVPEFVISNLSASMNLVDDIPHYSGLSKYSNLHVVSSYLHLLQTIENFLSQSPKYESETLEWFCSNIDTKSKITKVISDIGSGI